MSFPYISLEVCFYVFKFPIILIIQEVDNGHCDTLIGGCAFVLYPCPQWSHSSMLQGLLGLLAWSMSITVQLLDQLL